MKRQLLMLLGISIYLLLCYFLAMQIAYFLSFQFNLEAYRNSSVICWDYHIMWWQGNNRYFLFVTMWIAIGLLMFLMSILFPGNKNTYEKAKKRRLTKEERKQYTHLQSVHEAKKGLRRFEFNRNGHCSDQFKEKKYLHSWQRYVGWIIVMMMFVLGGVIITSLIKLTGHYFINGHVIKKLLLHQINRSCVLFIILSAVYLMICKFHIRDYCDLIFNPIKHAWNYLILRFGLDANKMMNELKYISVGDTNTCRRAGLPVITKRNKVWCVATDDHSLVVGTTNSGKTVSIIHIFIELCRMANTSVFINDIKGDLTAEHIQRYKDDGYYTVKLDFINPLQSTGWNPFGLAIQKYRKAQDKAFNDFAKQIEARNENERQVKIAKYLEMKKAYLSAIQDTLDEYDKLRMNDAEETEYLQASNALFSIKQQFYKYEKDCGYVKPNLSEASRDIDDYCRILCDDKDTKNTHFRDQAAQLMSGLVYYLLEYEYLDEKGNICRLDESEITFETINRQKDEGLKQLKFDHAEDYTFKLQWYLEYTRREDDYSVEKLQTIFSLGAPERGSILSTFNNKVRIGLVTEDVRYLIGKTTFDWDKLFNQKSAVFMIVNDERSTFHPFVSLFVTQLYLEAVQHARLTGGVLNIPWDIIWDEFGVSPAVRDLQDYLSTSRSRKIRWHLVVQEYAQIEETYGKSGLNIIRGNIGNIVYLLARNESTLEEVSRAAGSTMVWNQEQNNFDRVPLISKDQLAQFPLSQALVLRQRKNPFITKYLNYEWYKFKRKHRWK